MNDFVATYIQPGLISGLSYGIAAIGVSLPLRFLGTADFTAIGAMMLGGIIAVWGANATQMAPLALLLGSLAAGTLGLVTALLSLNRRFNVPLMLAGIICFTASHSIGLFVATDGQISLTDDVSFLQSIFTWPDAIIVGSIGISICLLGGVFARSKWGCLAFGLCANSRFVKFRHRHNITASTIILFVSNALIGLAGSILAMKTRQAYVEISPEFLGYTLGAIYAGHAGVQLFARLLKEQIPAEISIEAADALPEQKGFWESFRLSLSTQRDDSERMWFIFLSYVCAAVFLCCVTQSVRGGAIGSVSAKWEHLIVATIITIGLVFSNFKQAGGRKDEE